MDIAKSVELFKQAQEILPGGVDSPVRAFRAVGGQPLFIEQGAGAYLQDVDGNRYIDYVLSWGPLILGHAHPEVVAAVQQAAELGTSYGAPSPLEIELARMVQNFMPNMEMLRFVNSGTEATMTALRLARAYTKRNKIIKFEGCYHGHADLLLVQAGSGVATLGLPDSPGVPAATVQDTLVARYNNLDSVRTLFEAYPDEIAAIIIEPVAGNMGVVLPKDGFLPGLREITQEFGALLIFDEVMTGFRVHPNGAQARYNIQHPEELPSRWTQRLTKKLDLNKQESADVQRVFDQAWPRLNAIRAKAYPEVMAELDRIEERQDPNYAGLPHGDNIPADLRSQVEKDLPIWACDASGNCLVGEQADKIRNVDQIRKRYEKKYGGVENFKEKLRLEREKFIQSLEGK